MKQRILVIAIVAGFSVAAQADIYQWVDDRGVVHFTDDPDRIPLKYQKRVKEIPSPTAPVSTPGGGAPASNPQPAVKVFTPNLPGGLSEQAWRARYTALRAELKTLQDGLPQKREALDQIRRKRIIYQRSKDRLAYNEQMAKIEGDEARIKELEAQLSILDIEASRAGVPLEWRQ